MFITVKLLNGFQQPLTYRIPPHWNPQPTIGSLVQVPLKQQKVWALILNMHDTYAETGFIIREALQVEQLPPDPSYHQFIKELSAYYALEPLHLYKRIKNFLKDTKHTIPPLLYETTNIPPVQLTIEQTAIVDALLPYITTSSYQPTLLHGVTGSGKTEIYKKTMMHAHSLNKTTLLLLPEVSLAVQFTALLRAQLPAHIPIFGFHSATSATEKKQLWQALLLNKPLIIIGVHLPLLLPLPNLGAIIIDEEHDAGFQEKSHPKINTKEAALLRAQINKIPIILGSATPSLSSLHNIQQRGWHFFQLKNRFAGAFPKIQKIVLSKDKRPHFWISKELANAITDRLKKNEQTIIFINRRGYSFFVQCTACNGIFSCNSCSVSLTLHHDDQLMCHYCGLKKQLPSHCFQCSASSQSFLKKGIGTQQIVTILQQLFPTARIDRADLDATINKKKWQKTVTDFFHQKLDILVGTQTITKGYHFPHVTLVGIIWADINLSMPVYHAAETTLQQLIQVAGRAGRQSDESLVIVQTMTDHPIFNYLNEVDYLDFYHYEKNFRQLTGYPPALRFAEIELRHENEILLDEEALQCVELLHSFNTTINNQLTILGPAQPPVHKLNNIFIRKIYIKSPSINALINAYYHAQQTPFESMLLFTPNPLN